MEVFTGATDSLDWEAFIFKFEMVAERRGWDDLKRKVKLLECLSGPALVYIQKLKVQGAYEDVKKALALRFGPRLTPSSARMQLTYIQQREDESIEAFHQRVHSVAIVGYKDDGEDTIDKVAREAFLRGVRDKHAAEFAMNRRPKTYFKALEYVLKSQETRACLYPDRRKNGPGVRQTWYASDEEEDLTIMQTSTERQRQPSPMEESEVGRLQREMQQLRSLVEKQNELLTRAASPARQSRYDGYQQARRSPSRSPRFGSPRGDKNDECFYCNEKGHFKAECPKRQADLQKAAAATTSTQSLNG